MAKAFWPGYRWRILAHERSRTGQARTTYYTGTSHDTRSGWERHALDKKNYQELQGSWEFDELIIDDWFHLEQMDDRVWWMGVGNGDDYWHLHVRIDGKGKATVTVEKQ